MDYHFGKNDSPLSIVLTYLMGKGKIEESEAIIETLKQKVQSGRKR